MSKPIRYVTKVDLELPGDQQPQVHNRWHPDVPFAETILPGETVKIECLDWTGNQIRNDDFADDIKNVDLTRIHYLSGPFNIEGAQPGDCLVVEIKDVQPLERQPWGYCGIFPKHNGGGFLDKFYPEAAKAIFDLEGIHATSRHLPHVKFAGLIHPGIIGTAPSHSVLEEWNLREGRLKADIQHNHDTPVANLPEMENTHAGSATGEVAAAVAAQGARTIPGRPENGGNCDIKNLSRGSKCYLPVYVDGAKLSVGDLHFSQGDGEISFCGAIEMAGVITIKTSLIKGGMETLKLKSPMFIPGDVQNQYGPSRYLTFEGFSVDEEGVQQFLCATTAYRQACIRAIEYLRRFGYNDYQIYLLLSSAPIEGHIASIVDVPNACTTLGIPVDIFDFDIRPEAPIVKQEMGSCALVTGAGHNLTYTYR
ncbi:formamidase [Suhomyces tanzawaensis NRRL Y-17324]|uniref:Formamidase n=1 Tax=Suhomyces tanzawaensis NRRL Y-17324 TaxID=984487 RepID=A0A1E4SG62_9ASCO|nr:formamidase [Suhomyces tanzawaensis NRRL Y-17324]ODV78497.1 formamidase [Suhomyces tanzawaensis NRRL Y-17324]